MNGGENGMGKDILVRTIDNDVPTQATENIAENSLAERNSKITDIMETLQSQGTISEVELPLIDSPYQKILGLSEKLADLPPDQKIRAVGIIEEEIVEMIKRTERLIHIHKESKDGTFERLESLKENLEEALRNRIKAMIELLFPRTEGLDDDESKRKRSALIEILYKTKTNFFGLEDLTYFANEHTPRRSILPWEIISSLPSREAPLEPRTLRIDLNLPLETLIHMAGIPKIFELDEETRKLLQDDLYPLETHALTRPGSLESAKVTVRCRLFKIDSFNEMDRQLEEYLAQNKNLRHADIRELLYYFSDLSQENNNVPPSLSSIYAYRHKQINHLVKVVFEGKTVSKMKVRLNILPVSAESIKRNMQVDEYQDLKMYFLLTEKDK